MNKLKTIIIDDQKACIKQLSEDLKAYAFVDVVGTFESAESAKSIILQLQPDLMFIDVEMPEKTGIEFVAEIRNVLSPSVNIVFFSAYDKYMIDALRLSIFDFLVKPYTKDELDAVVFRALEGKTIDSDKIWSSLSDLLEASRKVAIDTLTSIRLVFVREIVMFTYSRDQRCWKVLLEDGNTYRLKNETTAGSILKFSTHFVQTSPTEIVNLDFVNSIELKTFRCSLRPPFDNLSIGISRRQLKTIKDKIPSV